MKFTFQDDTAPNIEELKKMASNKFDANERLKAVEELGKWKSRQSLDILWRLMINDLVFEVKNASFLRLQAFGEDVKLPKKPKGNLINQINQKLEKLIKPLKDEISYEEFLAVFQNKMPEAYDVYKHDKKDKFDSWLINILKSLPVNLRMKIKFDN
jgi:hypothetical protein